MQKIIGELNRMHPLDTEGMCEVGDEKPATWFGCTFQGTTLEPPEYIILCDEHGGSDD